MESLSGNCEIVEVKEELSSFNHLKGNHQSKPYVTERKSPRLEKGRKNSVEEDINKLFEAITLKNSAKGQDLSEQVGIGSSKKSPSKRPMRAGTSPPGIGFSEPLSLKQALRGLCISQASEMAAMKRSSLSFGSPRVSETGKIASLYRSVVVEAGESGLPLAEGRKGRLEISLNPEESNFSCPEKKHCNLEEPDPKSLSPHTHSSYCSAKPNSKSMESVLRQDESIPSAKEDKSPSLKVGPAEEENHTSLHIVPTYSSSGHASNINESISASIELSNYQIENNFSSNNLASKPAPKLRRKLKLQSYSSSTNVVRKSRRNTPRVVKPVIRRRNFPKQKVKQDSVLARGTSSASNDVIGNLVPNTSDLICQRCKCSLKDVITESSHKYSAPISASLNAEVSSSGRNFVAGKPGTTLSGRTVVKNNMYLRQSDKGEFSQSSKSSIGEYSSSTSLSEESYLSGSSCSNRPHMSRDLRWEAINDVRKQHGFLGLRHFNLLKKLGCGDIGTVYLAELIGRRCLFAIKVMDNEYLARRKKMPRAQTEREILRMLDHPFLPTLYAHFVSDNLSCLVVEYCPGGDLHVLRQKQPGRYYPEHAARFYVAEVLVALEYLHMLGVVYRDLKPENILVRGDGHIMLTDFDLSLQCSVSPTLLKSSSVGMEPPRISGPCKGSGCIDPFCAEPSCQVSCFSPRVFPAAAKTRKLKTNVASQVRSLPQLVAEPTDARSNSFVGTHEYLAPEIIKGEGHGSAVDWWTLGIFLYELLFGKTPFRGSGNEETLANVVLQILRFPDSPLVSFQARDLIRGLLVKEPENRFGYEKGAVEIKLHPFFDGLNWALIRCAVPPQIPEFCDVRIQKSHNSNIKYLDGGAAGEHMEFELF